MTDDYTIIENLKISRYICKFQIIYDRRKLMPKFVVVLLKYDSNLYTMKIVINLTT